MTEIEKFVIENFTGIKIPGYEIRPVSDIVEIKNGIMFFDTNWIPIDGIPGANPIHKVNGKITKNKKGFKIGDALLIKLSQYEQEYFKLTAYLVLRNWRDYIKSNSKFAEQVSREKIENIISNKKLN